MADNIISKGIETVTAHGHRTQKTEKDQRVRLRPKSGIIKFCKDSPILQPLIDTNGFMFVNTPIINVSYSNIYGSQDLTHSIQDFRYFIRNSSVAFEMTGSFPCENNTDAAYALSCLHFLRSVSKMHFGGFSTSTSSTATNVVNSLNSINTAINSLSSTGLLTNNSNLTSSDPLVGAPPISLVLNGYGHFMFNNVPVLLERFNFQLPNDADYVNFTVDGVKVWLPVVFDLTLSLTAQHTPDECRRFNYDGFRTGQLMKKGTWL